MPSRSRPIWQRSFSLHYIVCMSPLCTFPATRTIRRKPVTNGPRGRATMWVPQVHPAEMFLTRQDRKSPASQLAIVILTLPMGSRRLRLVSLFINSLLFLASIEFAIEDYLRDAPDVVFTRLGAIYPDRVKLAIRYPHHTDPIHVLWRKVRESSDLQAQPWTHGPPIMLSEMGDWVNSTTISPLWPDTTYECNRFLPFSLVVCFSYSTRFVSNLG